MRRAKQITEDFRHRRRIENRHGDHAGAGTDAEKDDAKDRERQIGDGAKAGEHGLQRAVAGARKPI